MIPLIFFILSSSSLFIIFRGLDKGRDPLQVILWNYFTCTILSLFFRLQEDSAIFTFQTSDWFLPALGLGALFLLNFSLTEQSVRQMGLGVSSIATKLSLILPFFFSVFSHGSSPGLLSWSGLLLCLAAIFLSSLKTGPGNRSASFSWLWLLPVAIFFGTGITDILTQWLNQVLVPAGDSDAFVLFVFAGAFFSALLLVVYRTIRSGIPFRMGDALPGIVLGMPNFISYKCILAALDAFHHQGNVVFPIANLGVIVLSSLVSAFYFRDSFSRWNIAGIIFACAALVLLFEY